MAAKPFGRRDKRCQRRRDEGVTARIRATTLGDSPHFTSATARRRRRSNSAAVPTGLILSYTLNRPGEVFSRAVLSNARPRRHGYLTLVQIAEKLDVSYAKIYRYIFEGKLKGKKVPSDNLYRFPDKPATLAQFRQLLDGQISQLYF